MTPQDRHCERCGAVFTVRFIRRLRQRFCCNRCAKLSDPVTPAADRFWVKVSIAGPNDCWLWNGSKMVNGYGSFYFGKTPIGAHRASWLLEHEGEEIPRGMLVLHACDTPACVNPVHLRLGTYADNVADMVAKGRNHPYKFTAEQVAGIRSDRRRHMDIALDFGVSRSLISAIKRGDIYKRTAKEM